MPSRSTGTEIGMTSGFGYSKMWWGCRWKRFEGGELGFMGNKRIWETVNADEVQKRTPSSAGQFRARRWGAINCTPWPKQIEVQFFPLLG